MEKYHLLVYITCPIRYIGILEDEFIGYIFLFIWCHNPGMQQSSETDISSKEISKFHVDDYI